jgi:tRNA A-37 threonylcarbamoyl transferase component Bud32
MTKPDLPAWRNLQMADSTHNPTAPENDEEFRKRYGELVGSGMSAVVYARDGKVAKVYRSGQPPRQVFQEAFTLVAVEEQGIPVPKVYGVETFLGRTTLIMEQVKGESLADMFLKNPEKTGECIDKVVELQVAMHKVASTHFRPIKLVLTGNIMIAPGLDDAERKKLLAMLEKLPDSFAILHGDFHGGNILFDGAGYKIIDWAEVALGDPAADVARSYMDYLLMERKDLSEMHLEKYCAATGMSRETILAWLPVMAGSLYGFLSPASQKILRPLF